MVNTMKAVTKSFQETQKLAAEFAKKLKGGEIIALVGEMGAGKTTFVQGLAQGLGIERRITSPTFIIMRRYETTSKSLFHLDLYRLEGNLENEVKNLGLADVWGKQENIVVIEWAEKIKNWLPKNTIWVNFDMVGAEKRRIDSLNLKV